MMHALPPQPRRPSALTGSAMIIAIGVTAIIFTAVMGLAAVILLTLKSTGNVLSANAAYYAAEASVEKALYSLVGHGSGYEEPSREQLLEVDMSESEYLTTNRDDDGGLAPLRVGSVSRAVASYIARSRATKLPVGSDTLIEVREHSSTTMKLSVDAPTTDAPDTYNPIFRLNLPDVSVDVRIPTLYTGQQSQTPDPPPDFRINPWRGPQTDPCYFQRSPTGPSQTPPNCPGWAEPGIVLPDDPDVGLPLFPFNFASRACKPPVDPNSPNTASGECQTSWTANPTGGDNGGFVSLDTPADASNADQLMIVRDVGAEGLWSNDDTYLLDAIWPVVNPPVSVGPTPVVGARMFDTDPPATTTYADEKSVIFTALPADRATYVNPATNTSVPGALSATGPAYERTHPDDYLYVDACTIGSFSAPPAPPQDPATPSCDPEGPTDARVSAPWNIEVTLSYTLADGTRHSAKRRILDNSSDPDSCVDASVATDPTAFNIRLSCLFPEARFPGFTTGISQNAPADVRLTLATNTRAIQVLRVTLQTDADDPATLPLGADEKTTITAIGTSGDSRQTLRTTVYQEETLPVFRKTTVF